MKLFYYFFFALFTVSLVMACQAELEPSPKTIEVTNIPIGAEKAEQLKQRQAYEQANAAYKKTLETGQFNTLDSIYLIEQIAYCQLIINDTEEVEDWLALAKKLLDGLANPPKSFLAQQAFNRARYLFLQQERATALPYAHQALNIAYTVYPEGHLRTAQNLTLLGLIHLPDGIITDSIHHYSLLTNDYFLRHPELEAYDWECDYLMGFYSLYTRAHEQGEYYCRTVLSKLAKLPFKNSYLEARAKNLLANMLKKQADAFVGEQVEAFEAQETDAAIKEKKLRYYQTADSLFQEAITIAEERKDWNIMTFYDDRVVNACRFTDSTYFFQAVQQFKERCAPLPNGMMHYYRLMGYYYYAKDTKKAIEAYNKALETINPEYAIDYRIYADIYYCLRNSYKRIGDFDSATHYATQSLLLYRCTPSKVDIEESNATELIDTSRSICLTITGFLAQDLFQKFQIEQKEEDLNLAHTYFDFVEQHSTKSLLTKDEDTFLSFQFEVGRKVYTQAIEAALASWHKSKDSYWVEKLFNYVEHLKSYLLYRDMLRKEQVDVVEHSLSDSIRILQGQVNQELFSSSKNEQLEQTQHGHTNLVNKLNQLENRRIQRLGNLEKHLRESRIKVAQIRKNLTPNSGLVSYINTKNLLVGLYVDRDTTIVFSKQNDDLKSTVTTFRNSIEKETRLGQAIFDSYFDSGHRLYQNLIQPFEGRLPAIEQLIIIPDERLSALCFEALLTEAIPKGTSNFRTLPYLLQQAEIVYTSSWKVFQLNQDRITKNFQNKSLGCWTTPELLASNGLDKLEQAIEKGFSKDYQVFKQSKGGKALFTQKHQQFDILHLLLHASSSKTNRYDNQIRFGKNSEDLLYGFDLYKEKFKANLIVLASCESASGTTKGGEGTFSLARSFINSGVPEVAAAQFLIPQTTTAPLLSHFYAALGQGKQAATALQQAKISYLKNIPNERYTYPRFWAGMVLYR